MANYIECRIRHNKMQEDGTTKIITDAYLVNAISFTEAEERIIKEVEDFISGELEVSAVKKCNASDIVFSKIDADNKWYKAKIQFITLDEEKGKEVLATHTYYIEAKDISTALEYANDYMKETLVDYVITGLNETKIEDVFPYEKPTK